MAKRDINTSAKALAQLLIDIDNSSKGVPASTGYTATNPALETLPPNMVWVRIRDSGTPILVLNNGMVDPQKPNAAVFIKPVRDSLNPNLKETQFQISSVDSVETSRRMGGNALNVHHVTSPELIKVGRKRLSEARVSVNPNNKWGLYISPYTSVLGTIPSTYYEINTGILSAVQNVPNFVYTFILAYDFNLNGTNVGGFTSVASATLTNGATPNIITLLTSLYDNGDEPSSSTIVLAAVTLRNGENGILSNDIIDLRETFNSFPVPQYDTLYVSGGVSTGFLGVMFNGTGHSRRIKRVSTFFNTVPSSGQIFNFYLDGTAAGIFATNAYVHSASSNSHSAPSAGFDSGQDISIVNPTWNSGSYFQVYTTGSHSASDLQVTIEYW